MVEAFGTWIGCGVLLLAGRSGGVLQAKMETDSCEGRDAVVSRVSSSSSSSFPAPALSSRKSHPDFHLGHHPNSRHLNHTTLHH